MSEHPAQAAVNAIMADENVSPDFRRALVPRAFLLCGCFRDGSFVCEEHKPKGAEMSLPSGYLPRKGDVVVIHVDVKFDMEPGEDLVHVKHDYNSFAVQPRQRSSASSPASGRSASASGRGRPRVLRRDRRPSTTTLVWIKLDEGFAWRESDGTVRSSPRSRPLARAEPIPIPVLDPPPAPTEDAEAIRHAAAEEIPL